jgi:hypothetical protein
MTGCKFKIKFPSKDSGTGSCTLKPNFVFAQRLLLWRGKFLMDFADFVYRYLSVTGYEGLVCFNVENHDRFLLLWL